MEAPETIDLYSARRDWLHLLRAASGGRSITITHDGRPIARLGPPFERPDAGAVVHDLDTARRCAHLRDLYGRPLLAQLLGISPERVDDLARTGLADEALFDQLTFLEMLGGILFTTGGKRAGRQWLTQNHASLRGHAPVSLLARPGAPGNAERRQRLMQLARQAFR